MKKLSKEEWKKRFTSKDTATLLFLISESVPHSDIIESILLTRGLNQSDIDQAKTRHVLTDQDIRGIEKKTGKKMTELPIGPDLTIWGMVISVIILMIIITTTLWLKEGWKVGLITFLISLLLLPFFTQIAERLGIKDYNKRHAAFDAEWKKTKCRKIDEDIKRTKELYTMGILNDTEYEDRIQDLEHEKNL